jgi:hypothetical protein
MILQRPSGYYVVLKQFRGPPIYLGGPYTKEAAKRKEDRLIKEYQATRQLSPKEGDHT